MTKSEVNPDSSASDAPPWVDLPSKLTVNILQRVDAIEILNGAERVCSTWRKLCRNPCTWRVIHIMKENHTEEFCNLMCRRAVDRSQGQLIDLTLGYFGRDDLLDYIVTRSSHLRRLKLISRFGISSSALMESVKKLPELEELHLMNTFISDIETIGFACPNLKSFSFSHSPWKPNNSVAAAIAKSMPDLIQLRIMSNSLDNNGLEAILDGCPHLESLDLHKCSDLHLPEPLRKRCAQQIKHLRLPH